MELSFESQELRSICESESQAAEQLSKEVADALRRRLADIRAANVVSDLLAGRPQISCHEGSQQLTIELKAGFYLVLEANHPKSPISETGAIQWERVRRLKVISIGPSDD